MGSSPKTLQESQQNDQNLKSKKAELKTLVEDTAPPLLPYLEERTSSIDKVLNIQEPKEMPVPDLQIEESSETIKEKGMIKKKIGTSEISHLTDIPDKKNRPVLQEPQQHKITEPSSFEKPKKRVDHKKVSQTTPTLRLRLGVCDEGRAQLLRHQYQDALSAFSRSIQNFSTIAFT